VKVLHKCGTLKGKKVLSEMAPARYEFRGEVKTHWACVLCDLATRWPNWRILKERVDG
jgi:hypothetical protein